MAVWIRIHWLAILPALAAKWLPKARATLYFLHELDSTAHDHENVETSGRYLLREGLPAT
jgi:hypothetical protein